MAIKDYKNSDEILKTTVPVSGEWIKDDDKSLLELQFEEKAVKFDSSKTEHVELHVYDLQGNLLASNHDVDGWRKSKPEHEQGSEIKQLYMDPHKNLRELGFKRGEYKFVYNFIRPLIGKYNSQTKLFLKSISSNKKELVLSSNILPNGNETIDELYIKFREQIDKFFDIENRIDDVKQNLDSVERDYGSAITIDDNKSLYEKFQSIRKIGDILVSNQPGDTDEFREQLIDKWARETVSQRQLIVEHPNNNDLRKYRTDVDYLYYYIHEMPNAKMKELRDEFYTVVDAKGKIQKLPTGIDNVPPKSDKQYQTIVNRNKAFKEIIKNYIEDDDYKFLSDVDKLKIHAAIIRKNQTLRTPISQIKNIGLVPILTDPTGKLNNNPITSYDSLGPVIYGQANLDRIVNKGDVAHALNLVSSLPATVKNIYDRHQRDIEDFETKLIARGNQDAFVDAWSGDASSGVTGRDTDASEWTDISSTITWQGAIQARTLLTREIKKIEALFDTYSVDITDEELEQYIDDAKDAIDDKITLNTIELNQADVEFITQPADGYFHFYNLNFNNDTILKVVNIARLSENEIAVKLYEDLPKTITEKQTCRLEKHILDSYVDNIILIPELDAGLSNTLRSPNFNIDTHDLDSKETEFQNWSELLGNAATSQQIINHYFSGSGMGDVKLNINYGEFENFVHFGSATERVENFWYKMQLIEFYDARLATLNSASLGGNVTNITDTMTKKNAVIAGFDDWENWLYFNSGSQELYSFTSASVDPYPKPPERIVTNPLTWIQAQQQWQNANYTWINGNVVELIPNQLPYEQLSTTHPQSIAWYRDTLALAKEYDRDNIYALYRTIPEHIRSDNSNADYELFVNMIGQHFDIMWTYINQLTKVHTREEHPKEGIPDDLIYDVAQSMGWNLANGNYDAKLWNYVMGSDENNVYQTSGSFMTSKSKDKVTKEIWRRQLNNLPYLLKTKGTERSVRALVACYGIPQSILTVREYGGPSRQDKRPTYNKTQFDYALNIRSGSYVQTEWAPVNLTNTSYRYPDTITLRFKTHNRAEFNYPAYGTHTLLQSGTGSNVQFFVDIEPTGSNGNLHFYLSGSNGYYTASVLDQDIFDDGFTSIMIQRETSTDVDTTNNTYNFYVKKSKWGKLTINQSASIDVDGSTESSYNNAWTTSGSFYIGYGNTTAFTGSVQELRYWTVPLNEPTFNNHVTSVGSYNSNEVTGSYTDLQFRIELSNRQDFSTSLIVSSSHPNQEFTTFENGNAKQATFEGVWGTAYDWYGFDEIQYIEGPSMGGNNLYSEKIRIEDSKLLGTLTPKARMELSAFDFAPKDSKRLGVYFSPQSIINDDIMRHMGFFEIDDYIGSPADLYKPAYPELKDIAQEYWKKYANRNDVAAYIRLFSVFDFTMFQQIKQLLPARANAITGLVIEPNVLERNKIPVRVKPEKKELDHNALIDDPNPNVEAVETTHKGEIEKPEDDIFATQHDHEGEVQDGEPKLSSDKHDYVAGIDDVAPTLESEQSDYTSTLDLELKNLPQQEDKKETFTVKDSTLGTTPGNDIGYAGDATQTTLLSGDRVWSYIPTNIVGAPNGTYVYVRHLTSGNSRYSYMIKTKSYGFAIPSNATIKGIEVSISKFASGPGSSLSPQADETVALAKTGYTQVGDNKASGTAWPIIATPFTYGSSTDLWGTTWTPTDINSSDFGCLVRTINNTGTGLYTHINSVGITVYYETPTGTEKQTVTYTDYDYHNREAVVDMPKEEILEAELTKEEVLLEWKDFSLPATYCHDYLLFNKDDDSLPFLITSSTPPWLCQPTESYIGESRTYGTAQINGYWIHRETEWMSPASSSTYSSSLVNWTYPGSPNFPMNADLPYDVGAYTTSGSSAYGYAPLDQGSTFINFESRSWEQPGISWPSTPNFSGVEGLPDNTWITASLDYGHEYRLLGTLGDGTIYYSDNGGVTWNNGNAALGTSILSNSKKTSMFVPGSVTTGFSTTTTNIYKTTDGGATWTNKYSVGYTYNLHVLDDNHVVSGINTGVVYTSDGGTSWSNIGPASVRHQAVWIQDAGTIWVGNSSKQIHKTTDSGSSWTLQYTHTHEITHISFYNTNIGVATSTGVALYTTDGGTTWNVSSTGVLGVSNVVWLNETTAIASSAFPSSTGGIYKTTDSGVTWTQVYSLWYVYDVIFKDQLVGWAVNSYGGTGILLTTLDGGDTWTSTTLAIGITDLSLVTYDATVHINNSLVNPDYANLYISGSRKSQQSYSTKLDPHQYGFSLPSNAEVSEIRIKPTVKAEHNNNVQFSTVALGSPFSTNIGWSSNASTSSIAPRWSTGSEQLTYIMHGAAGILNSTNINSSYFGSFLVAVNNGFPNTTYEASNAYGSGWTGATQAKIEDGIFASVNLASTQTSNYLSLNNYNINVSGKIVKGVEVKIKRKKSLLGTFVDSAVTLWNPVLGYSPDNKANATPWTITSQWVTYGGPDDLWGWGLQLTPAQLANSNFGPGLRVKNNGPANGVAYVDAILVTVYYDDGTNTTNAYIDSVEMEVDYATTATTQNTYTAVYNNFGFNIDPVITNANAPYNSVIRGITTKVKRKAELNTNSQFVTDVKAHIGTNLTASVGENLIGDYIELNWAGSGSQSGSGYPWNSAQLDSGNVEGINNGSQVLTNAWIGPGNGTDSATLLTQEYGFNIPTGSTIEGIEVTMYRQHLSSVGARDPKDKQVKLFVNSIIGHSEDKSDSNSWITYTGGSDGVTFVKTYGGPTDTWGRTWVYHEINSSDFGVVHQVQNTIGGTQVVPAIDAISIKVYATEVNGWSTTSQTVYYGTNTTKWGQSFTFDDVNSEEFNFQTQARIVGGGSADIEDVQMKVYYSYYVSASNSNVQEYVPLGIERQKYKGSQITSPDINEPSNDTFDKGPVVEVTQANPNGLILKRQTATRGNLDIDRAPITITRRGR